MFLIKLQFSEFFMRLMSFFSTIASSYGTKLVISSTNNPNLFFSLWKIKMIPLLTSWYASINWSKRGIIFL